MPAQLWLRVISPETDERVAYSGVARERELCSNSRMNVLVMKVLSKGFVEPSPVFRCGFLGVFVFVVFVILFVFLLFVWLVGFCSKVAPMQADKIINSVYWLKNV